MIRRIAFAWLLLCSTAMAANKVLVPAMDGTPKQVVFAAYSNGFSPTAANDLRISTDGSNETQVLIQMSPSGTGVANNAARQSAKVDLGAKRATRYAVRGAVELASSGLTAGNVIELWWAPSSSSTAATGNPGGVSGSDGSYAGYSSNLDASIKQLQYIGDFVVTTQATANVQVAEIGVFVPRERYGSLIVYNRSGASFHTDDDEVHFVFDPIVEEVQ